MIKDMFIVFFELFLTMIAFMSSLFVAGFLVIVLVASILYFAGFDVSPNNPHYQAQITKCYEKEGTAVLDNMGYLKECWVGVPRQ